MIMRKNILLGIVLGVVLMTPVGIALAFRFPGPLPYILSKSVSGSLKAEPIEAFVLNTSIQKVDFDENPSSPEKFYWDTKRVKFSTPKGKAIIVNSYNRYYTPTVSGEYSLSANATFPATSQNSPLQIDFRSGALAVAFYMGGASEYEKPIVATIKAFDKNNKNIGEIQQEIRQYAISTFVGFSSTERIYRVTVDYGNTTISEDIDSLMFSWKALEK